MLRTRWATLTLFLLAPFTAEVLTASTPIIVFLTNPIGFIVNPLLYGCGALLIREIVRRNHLGWGAVLWLGAAYGIFEEGIVLNTWADPWAQAVCAVVAGNTTGICDYGRIGAINWLWAVPLTAFHAIISITTPILLAELLFPRRAGLPWLRGRGIAACIVGLGLCLAFGLALNVADFRQHGFAGPPAYPYAIELGLMVGCVVMACRRRPPQHQPGTRKAPRLWWLRVLGFIAGVSQIFLNSLYSANHLPVAIGLACDVLFVVVAISLVTRWSHQSTWDERHMLALISGWLGFFIFFWAPIAEILGSAGGKPTRGTGLVAICYLILLIVLARRTARRVHERAMAEVKLAASGDHNVVVHDYLNGAEG